MHVIKPLQSQEPRPQPGFADGPSNGIMIMTHLFARRTAAWNEPNSSFCGDSRDSVCVVRTRCKHMAEYRVQLGNFTQLEMYRIIFEYTLIWIKASFCQICIYVVLCCVVMRVLVSASGC